MPKSVPARSPKIAPPTPDHTAFSDFELGPIMSKQPNAGLSHVGALYIAYPRMAPLPAPINKPQSAPLRFSRVSPTRDFQRCNVRRRDRLRGGAGTLPQNERVAREGHDRADLFLGAEDRSGDSHSGSGIHPNVLRLGHLGGPGYRRHQHNCAERRNESHWSSSSSGPRRRTCLRVLRLL